MQRLMNLVDLELLENKLLVKEFSRKNKLLKIKIYCWGSKAN